MPLIHTTMGEIAEALLEKTTGIFEDENEKVEWIEYRLEGVSPPVVENGICLDCQNGCCRSIHRSVNIVLKKSIFSASATGGFS